MYLNDEKEEFINLAFEVGESLGILFQMKDDELGIWGDEKLTGKGLLGDVVKNKKTILRYLLFSLVKPKEKEKLKGIFGKSYISNDDKHYLEFLFNKYDVKQKHQDIMKSFYNKMQVDINKLPKKYADVFNFVYKYNEERSR